MICKQKQPTVEQISLTVNLFSKMLEETDDTPVADKVAMRRKMFEAILSEMRTKRGIREISIGMSILSKFDLSAAAAVLASVYELARTLNDLEIEQYSKFGPLSKDEHGENNVL